MLTNVSEPWILQCVIFFFTISSRVLGLQMCTALPGFGFVLSHECSSQPLAPFQKCRVFSDHVQCLPLCQCTIPHTFLCLFDFNLWIGECWSDVASSLSCGCCLVPIWTCAEVSTLITYPRKSLPSCSPVQKLTCLYNDQYFTRRYFEMIEILHYSSDPQHFHFYQ